ncbi:MAG TPA: hypothetical protein VFH87_01645 [Candidatus Udaeobacter sp.]|nr:hypothetical protein [Candidatus Udaeobacter sp.]
MGWTKEQWTDFCGRMGIDPRQVLKRGQADLAAEAAKRQKERNQRAKETRARQTAARKAKGPLAIDVPYSEREQDKNVALEAPAFRTQSELAAPRSGPRVKITIRGIRVRLLDPDNFVAGCKGLVDGLVASGIAPGDSAKATQEGAVAFFYEQQLCSAFSKEATEIEIELADSPPES